MSEPTYSLYLTIRHAGKTIPYPSASREDSQNHGFLPLKGHPERVVQIPEAQAYPALAQSLKRLNASGTIFYTAGCDWSLNSEDDERYWAKGYIDLVFVDPMRAESCHAYFDLFCEFEGYLHEKDYDDPIDFHWELEQTDFMKDGNVGWTVCLWVTTDFYREAENCQSSWETAVDLFCSFIEQVDL